MSWKSVKKNERVVATTDALRRMEITKFIERERERERVCDERERERETYTCTCAAHILMKSMYGRDIFLNFSNS